MSSSHIEIMRAGPGDEAELRSLLGTQSMPGWVELGFEREPDYFAAARIEGERHGVLLARQRTTPGAKGELVAICARTTRRVYVNGEVQLLGYVGQFRTASLFQTGWSVYRLLRSGFKMVEGLHRADELPYDITSILSDNDAARRLLTAGLRGIPEYKQAGHLETLVYRCGGLVENKTAICVESGSSVGLAAISDCLRSNYRRFQFAPVWDEAALTSAGLAAEDFLVIRDGNRVTACLAIWDQRSVRQMIVRGYRGPIQWLRPLINIGMPLLELPSLPRAGTSLRYAWLSHLACDRDDSAALEALLPAALARGYRLGLEQLMLGLCDRHPLLSAARKIRRHLSYRSEIYLIRWESLGGDNLDESNTQPMLLESATL